MTAPVPQTVYLSDYRVPPYLVDQVELRFELDPADTHVHSRLHLRRNPEGAGGPLVLNGENLELLSLELDGTAPEESAWEQGEGCLTLHRPPERFVLETTVRLCPESNTALEGLYVSGGNFCTQCEAEGFRTITFFPDRPDVMARFHTTIVADRAKYPVLLSNGNRLETGELEDGRHFAVWEDPFPKPAYLFALVAGDLACVADRFTTRSGREVRLEIWVQHGNEDKTPHAMRSLKKAMAWDEEKYGREYDLDIYMIVAVDDFNMGAMENKGLNIFNSRFVLARPDTATDMDFVNIEGVIAHEYFHNWSGNRVTCRDWFQLSLKEGFTVFRDSQFTADMNSPAVKRIDDVRLLRERQFPEDAGPTAHPVRPASYVEVNNFYTLTVYEKGAEVVRMLHTLLGHEGFRAGTDLYFERHDGQAVTCDDFVKALEDANGVDLTQFRRWYAQAGTPQLEVERAWDAEGKRYTLSVRQSCPATPGQPTKEPYVIPLKLALLDRAGNEVPLRLEGEAQAAGGERVLALTESEHRFTFVDVAEEPVPSLLRGFSAPVRLTVARDDAELAFLMGHESDDFNRWDAAQELGVRVMLRQVQALLDGGEPRLESCLDEAFANTLRDEALDPALVAEALTLPAEEYVAEFMAVAEPLAIHRVRRFLRRELAEVHQGTLLHRYRALAETGPYSVEPAAMARRRLKNAALAYLVATGSAQARRLAGEQFAAADNMTDSMAALTALVHHGAPEADEALAAFYQRWRQDPLVLDKWFALQATAPVEDAVARVEALTRHPDFTIRNPNRVRSVVGAFAMRNPAGFHSEGGAGYRLLADQVIALDRLNPQVAARLTDPLVRWRRFGEARGGLMREQLERILAAEGVSRDVYEIASKGLAG